MTTTTAPDARPSQGDAIDLASVAETERKRAFDAAFDYRGDVTLTLADGTAVELLPMLALLGTWKAPADA